jgi:hypothetical protein
MTEYTNNQDEKPKNAEPSGEIENGGLDRRREIFRANRDNIRRVIDDLLIYDDHNQAHLVAELINIIFKETYQDKLQGEGYYYLIMRQIFLEHQGGQSAFDNWTERNGWQGT